MFDGEKVDLRVGEVFCRRIQRVCAVDSTPIRWPDRKRMSQREQHENGEAGLHSVGGRERSQELHICDPMISRQRVRREPCEERWYQPDVRGVIFTPTPTRRVFSVVVCEREGSLG